MNCAALRQAVVIVAALAVIVGLPHALAAQAPAPNNQDERAVPATAQVPGGQAPAQPSATAQPSADPNKVVLTVGDQKLTAGEIEALINDLPTQQQQLLRRTGKRVLADELVRIKLFAQEAKKRKLDETPKVKRQLELTRDQILASSVAADLLRKNYEENKEKYEKIQARHILIRTPGSRAPVRPGQKELTEAEAKAKVDDLRKKLAGGADFAEMARKESDDTVSGAAGGDLDVFGRGAMVPEFDKVAFGLKEGEISEPVKTPFGYHIIQVTNVLSFDELQQEIAGQSNAQIMKMVEDLRKNTNVQVDESYFGTAPGAPGTPGIPGAPGAAPGQTGRATPPRTAPPQGGVGDSK